MELSAFWVGILAAVLGSLILAELLAWSPRVAVKLTAFAAGRLPACSRARFREEWLAYLADMPTGFSKLIAAVGFVGAAERDRIGKGLRAFRAVGDYVRIRRVLRADIAEARAFGGAWLALRLKLRPCGNRHFVVDVLFPPAAVPFINEYRRCRSREVNDELDLSTERQSIVRRARDAIGEPAPAAVNVPLRVFSQPTTDYILPVDRDPRAMRTLLILLWRLRRRIIRQRYRILERQR